MTPSCKIRMADGSAYSVESDIEALTKRWRAAMVDHEFIEVKNEDGLRRALNPKLVCSFEED